MSKWWLHWNERPALYHRIGRGSHFQNHPTNWEQKYKKFDRVITVTRVSKTLAFSFISPNLVYSDATVVVTSDKAATFAILQSNIHSVFAWQHSSRLKNDLRYSPTDALEPFPMPEIQNLETLEMLGSELHHLRSEFMKKYQFGLTKFYNTMHKAETSKDNIERMRELHQAIDEAVVAAYNWDIDLRHGFHKVPYLPENDCIRFTISEDARLEVLRRLADLNRKRYKQENDHGLHDDSNSIKNLSKNKQKQPENKATALPLDLPELAFSRSDQTKNAILNFLRTRGGQHGKINIFSNVRMKNSEWEASIKELLNEALVICTGNPPNETYSAAEDHQND